MVPYLIYMISSTYTSMLGIDNKLSP